MELADGVFLIMEASLNRAQKRVCFCILIGCISDHSGPQFVERVGQPNGPEVAHIIMKKCVNAFLDFRGEHLEDPKYNTILNPTPLQTPLLLLLGPRRQGCLVPDVTLTWCKLVRTLCLPQTISACAVAKLAPFRRPRPRTAKQQREEEQSQHTRNSRQQLE
eukprot:344061-Pelagomonas_calceolata.AAC.1